MQLSTLRTTLGLRECQENQKYEFLAFESLHTRRSRKRERLFDELASPGGLTSGPGVRVRSTDNEDEKGGEFERVLHRGLLGGHDADLGVSSGRPAKGEAAEGSVVRPSCSNSLTCFARVIRCALPAIAELASLPIIHILEKYTL